MGTLCPQHAASRFSTAEALRRVFSIRVPCSSSPFNSLTTATGGNTTAAGTSNSRASISLSSRRCYANASANYRAFAHPAPESESSSGSASGSGSASVVRQIPSSSSSTYSHLPSSSARSPSSPFNSSSSPEQQHPDRDEAIAHPSTLVRVVSPTDKTLGPPVPLTKALQSLDRSTDFLVRVSPASQPGPPICRILPKQQVREQERAKAKLAAEQERAARAKKYTHNHNKKTARTDGAADKVLELSWKIERGDLDYRLHRLRAFLGKGYRVEVVLGGGRKKKGQRKKTGIEDSDASALEKAKALVQAVRDAAAGVEGAREVRAMSGAVGEVVRLCFEGSETKPVAEGKTNT